jgi:hypothetical protein
LNRKLSILDLLDGSFKFLKVYLKYCNKGLQMPLGMSFSQ